MRSDLNEKGGRPLSASCEDFVLVGGEGKVSSQRSLAVDGQQPKISDSVRDVLELFHGIEVAEVDGPDASKALGVDVVPCEVEEGRARLESPLSNPV